MAGLLGGIRINDQKAYEQGLDAMLGDGMMPVLRSAEGKPKVLDVTDELLLAILEKLDEKRPKIIIEG